MESVTPLFNASPRPAATSRHGQPWEPSDYDLLVSGVRAGLHLQALATHVARVESSVRQRIRRLLPLAHRGCLPEHVLPALREALADPDYDWRAEMLLTPAPPPVIRNEVTRTGIPGLTNDDLVTVGYALLACCGDLDNDLLLQVTRELEHRDLVGHVVDLRAHRSVRASPLPISEDAAWADASYWVRGRTTPVYWRGRIADASDW